MALGGRVANELINLFKIPLAKLLHATLQGQDERHWGILGAEAEEPLRREEGHRRRGRRAEDDMALSTPTAMRDAEDQAVERVVSQQVRTALGELPPAQREALALAYYGGYTQREVAALTGVPLGTVKTRMLSGMRKLRRDLSGSAGPAGEGRGTTTPTDGTGR